jgi:hypothetical protein
MRALAGLLFFTLGIAFAAPDSDGLAPPATPTVEQLIRQLGDANTKVRDKANLALELMGPGILPRLRQAQDHADPEVRRRLANLIAGLEKANLLQPKRVSLRLNQRPIREAVTELARQSGYAIELYPAANSNDDREKQHYSLHLDNVTFWEALEKVCREGGLVVQRTWGEDSRVQLRFAEEYVPYVHHSGAFRLIAQGFQHHRGIEFGSLPRTSSLPGQRSEQLTFRFSFMVEPRMPMLWIGRVALSEAIDDQKNSMLPSDGTTTELDSHSYNDRGYVQDAWVNLVRVSRDSHTVKKLRGVVPVRLLVEQAPEIVVEKVLEAKGRKFKSDATELEIEDLKEQPGAATKRYEVKFSVTNLRPGGLEYNFYSSVRHRLELRDAKGVKYNWGGGGWGGNENNVRGTFGFHHPGGEAGPPARLIFNGWTTLYHRVPFEFQDLPLP